MESLTCWGAIELLRIRLCQILDHQFLFRLAEHGPLSHHALNRRLPLFFCLLGPLHPPQIMALGAPFLKQGLAIQRSWSGLLLLRRGNSGLFLGPASSCEERSQQHHQEHYCKYSQYASVHPIPPIVFRLKGLD